MTVPVPESGKLALLSLPSEREIRVERVFEARLDRLDALLARMQGTGPSPEEVLAGEPKTAPDG